MRRSISAISDRKNSHDIGALGGQTGWVNKKRIIMRDIRTVAVFCGARSGVSPIYRDSAEALGRGLAKSGIRLVYGGGSTGMMGTVADAVLAAGGEVVGVIPEFLTKWEQVHAGVADMTVTDSMHTRKRQMFEQSDAFITMPGGLGTFDETIEIITWRQLKLHDKPILLCDVDGSAQPLVAMIEAAITWGFAMPEVRRLYEIIDGVDGVLDRLGSLSRAQGEPEVARL
jgi:uncharacterized protein (TIGR00730 family)